MKQTDTRPLFSIPWADQADSSTIATIPQSATAIGRASMALGFPKATMTPIAAGGVPPYGEDMNGILNMLSRAARTAELGILHPFSGDYATAINGYPVGATIAHPTIAGRFLICTADNNTNDPSQSMNGWLDPLGNYATATALQQETQRAQAAEAAIFQLPAWVPLPSPFTTAPAGFIPADGRSFTTSQCPQLASAFPSGSVPDLRGLFIRGLDTSGTRDPEGAQRSPTSFQEGSYLLNRHDWDGSVSFVPNGNANISYRRDNVEPNTNWNLPIGYGDDGAAWANYWAHIGVARPKNSAWNYIFRAA